MRALKQSRQRAALFGALLAVLTITSSLVVGLIGFLAHAETQGTRIELATRSGLEAGLEVSLALDVDAQTQDEQVRARLAEVFVNRDRAIPISIHRTLEGADNVKLWLTDSVTDSTAVATAVVRSVPDLSESATLVDGAWPTSDDEVSVQVDAADTLGLPVGTRFTLGGTVVSVVATWRVNDALDPRWLGDQHMVDGSDDRSVGPIVIAESAWPKVGTQVRALWTITPVIELVESSDLSAILVAWDGIRDTLGDGGIDTVSFDERGRLTRTVQQVQERVDALRSVEPVALLIIIAIALVAVVELARLLNHLRAAELLLMWSRGATARGLAAASLVEAVIVGTVGAALGSVLALRALDWLAGGPDAARAAGAAVWLVPAIAVPATALVVAATTLLSARSFSRLDKPDDAGRTRPVVGLGAVVLVTVAAVVSTWQLLLYGSPLTPARDGGKQVDPVAVLAPALALLSLVLLVLLAIPLAAPFAERAARHARGISSALVSRTLVRRLRIAATPLVVIGLATGQFAIAAGYGQTWDHSYTVTSQLRLGSDLRLTAAGNDLASGPIDHLINDTEVTAFAPVFQDIISVGLDSAALVAATPAAIRDLATEASGVFDRVAIADAITADPGWIVVPSGTVELQAHVKADGLAEPPFVSLILADDYGSMRIVSLDENFRTALPQPVTGAQGTWRVAGFEVIVRPPQPGDSTLVGPNTVRITGLTTQQGVALELGGNWTAVGLGRTITALEPTDDGPGFVLTADVDRVRLLPRSGGISPVAISQTLATRNRVGVGDTLYLAVDSRATPLPFIVSAIVPAVPSSQYDAAILVDLGSVQATQLRLYRALQAPGQLWVELPDHVGGIESLRASLPAGVRIQSLVIDPGRGILQSGSIALWIGAGGAALLALAAVAAVLSAQLRSRRPETLVLRALGVASVAIATIRRREIMVAIAAGVVVGTAAGLIVTYLTVPPLARAAVPNAIGSLPTTVEWDVVPLLIALASLLVASAVLVGGYGMVIVRQVRRSPARKVRQ